MNVLIDSDILIAILRGYEDPVDKLMSLVESGARLFCSSLSEAEVLSGVRSGELGATRELFSRMRCIGVECEVGRLAGEYLNRYRPSHGVQLADAVIAASAKRYDLRLWTLNRKHFPMDDITLL